MHRLFLLLAVTGAALVSAVSCGSSRAADRPNIVFLMTDDQCTYSLGCYGNRDVQTPNIDQLSRQGITFDHHYDTTAICMGSRANVMTGKYEYRNGCNFEHGPLLREHWTRAYPMLLREAGYFTAMAGKIGFEVADRAGQKGRLPEQDFDWWGAGPGQTSYDTAKNASMVKYAREFPHSTLAYGAFGRDFIHAAAKKDSPFCLSISFKAPHRPVDPDPRYDGVYRGKIFRKPDNYGREHGLHFSEQSRQGRQYARFAEWNYDKDYDGVMAKYYQQIYAVDVAVGMIRTALTDSGTAENTIVIFTSDNGFLCGSHGYGSKVLPYEEASRVPLIVYDPRHTNSGRGLRCSALTGNIDFAPTMLEYAGVSLPEMDGRSLVSLYDDPTTKIRDELALINVWGPEAVHSLSIVTDRWKYIYWPYSEGEFEPAEELYDLAADRLELKNLAATTSHRETLEKMREHYDRQVEHWKTFAVPYHDYQRFADGFVRAR